MEETFKKLSELIGKGGRIEESEKSIKRKKEKFFLDIIISPRIAILVFNFKFFKEGIAFIR